MCCCSKRSADELQSNIIPPWSSAAVTHRSLLNIFYILTHTLAWTNTHACTQILKQSVSHDPSKCGLFVRPLRYKIAKGAKSLHLYVSLLLWTSSKCNFIYEKGTRTKRIKRRRRKINVYVAGRNC